MNLPLRLSLSQTYVLRYSGIYYRLNGALTDPRTLLTPRWQLLAPGVTSFGTWADGSWEAIAPDTGPWAVTVPVGADQPDAVNPGEAGTYIVWLQYDGLSETPTFQIGQVVLAVP
jgi:hypothetical protein